MSSEHEPRILALLCNWCSYAGADLAGVSRLQYPPNILVLRVMCTGRIEPHYVLRAFPAGFKAVMVLGCHPGECHYHTGNLFAEKKIMMVAKLLDLVGLGSERLLLDWVSSAEGGKFAGVVTGFCERVKSLPRLEIDTEMMRRIRAAEETVMSECIRTLVAKQWPIETRGNVYRETVATERFQQILDAGLEQTFMKKLILQTIKERPLSVPDIAGTIGEKLETISFYLTNMWNRGEVRMEGVDGDYHVFMSS